MSIGIAAERAGCSVATVRFYEETGLLRSVQRAANGRRVYGWPDIFRLRLVRRCRDLGFPIDQVRSLLAAADAPEPDCLAVRDLAATQVDLLRAKRRELDELERSLSALTATCDAACATGRSPTCTILDDLGAASG